MNPKTTTITKYLNRTKTHNKQKQTSKQTNKSSEYYVDP
jgi:hypothetical protein